MSLLNEASFLVTPNSYKEDKLYAAIPTNGNGDMTFARTGRATRVNEAGLVELVPYNLLTRSEEFDNASWTKGSGVSVTANTTIAPDGTLTAYTLIGASSIDWGDGNSSLRRQPADLSSSTTYTLSLYVKSLGSTTFQTSIRDNNAGGQVTVSHSINSDTWTRVEQIYTTTPDQTIVGIIFGGTDGNVAIWGAQLVKGSSALTYQKTVDRLDIPRIDYTDAKRTNLLTYSENFDDASFIKGLSLPIETDSTTAPDGTLTADTWTGNGVDGVHKLTQTVSATSGVTYTQSVFAKKDTNDFIQILGTAEIYDSNSYANFDLESGDVGDTGTSATATITDFGDGWYRCTMTATATTTASGPGFTLRLITSAGSVRAETNSLETGVHLWGAQVEAGAYPTSYIPTHTMPVTIYDGCPSILLEPLRTNLLTYSEQFDNDIFTKNFTEVSANTTTAPDGSLTADTLSGDETSNIHFLAQTASATSGVTYTQSVFAKKGTNNFLQIIGTTTGSQYDAYSWANFDLENGALGTIGSSATATITYFGNGWYRCTMTATATATASGNGFLLCLITSANSLRAETNSLATSVHIWGAQVEQGAHPSFKAAYPTSYIPTTNIALTRIADAMIVDNVYTNNLITDEGGTWYTEIDNNFAYARDGSSVGIFIANDTSGGVYSDGFALRNNGATARLTINKRIATVQQQLGNTLTDHVKVAIKWGGGKAKVFVNGAPMAISLGVYETEFTPIVMQYLGSFGGDVSKYIKQMALFPTPLSDDQCIALTTL
jgi:hypothetical protein